MTLNTNRQRFVAALLASPTYNQAEAYMLAYGVMERQRAAEGASKLMAVDEVREAVEKGKAARLARLTVTADDVLRDVVLGLRASGTELVEHVLDSCRYCHGDGHKYQFTPAEFERALEAYLQADRLQKGGAKDPMGLKFIERHGCNVGYDPRRPPAEDCPECFGRGVPQLVAKDTRFLTEEGRRMYAGAKNTKHGVEIQSRDRDKALDLAAKHTGVSKETLHIDDVRQIPDDELARRTAQAEHRLRQAMGAAS
jgi:phage terminase small subunit